MEVAVSMRDSRSLSPSLQHHRPSRYPTPDISHARSPARVEPVTAFPLTSSEETDNMSNTSLPETQQHQSQGTHLETPVTNLRSTMDADGQDHDRMDTDNASDTSASEQPTPLLNAGPVVEVPVNVPAIMDGEAMDTTPDSPDAGDVRLPSNPYNEAQGAGNGQDIEEEHIVNRNLVRTNSRGSTVASSSPTNTPPPLNAPDSFTSVIIDPTTGEQVDMALAERVDIALAAQEAGDGPSLLPDQTASDSAQNPPETQPPPPQEDDREEGQEEESPDEDSVDEEEQPYWASFVDDKSAPSEEELKLIEQDTEERSALDDEYWESLAYEPLDDPEYSPIASGRVEWTLKGFHGTPENPNKEFVLRSPSVLIGGYYWNIKVYPRGNENTDMMSVYVECSTSPKYLEANEVSEGVTNSNPPMDNTASQAGQLTGNQHEPEIDGHTESSLNAPGGHHQPMESAEANESSPTVAMEDAESEQPWEIPAQVLCIAYNPEEPRVHAYQKVTHRYHRDTSDWGWTRFHGPWDRLHRRERLQRKAMLCNNTLCFTAYIRTVKDDTGALWWHSPANRDEWDCFERLGLNRLWVGSPESSSILCAVSTWLHISSLCPTIVNPLITGFPEARKSKNRPLLEEIRHVQSQLRSVLEESRDNLSLRNITEMIDWNNANNFEPDVVAALDILRRALSYEARDVRNVKDAKDIFEDILLLRQPEPAVIGSAEQSMPGKITVEQSSAQEAVNTALSCLRSGNLPERPAILQVELHRQSFDTISRKWKKLTHHISLDESIRVQANTSSETAYTLFGVVVHSGDLESKDYYSVIRPRGPGTRWIKYAGDKAPRGVECLTTNQALRTHEGSDTAEQTAAVAYLLTYVRSDLLSNLPSEAKVQNSSASQNDESLGQASEMSNRDEQVPIYIYQSSVFGDHQGLGVADWSSREADDERLLKLEAPSSILLADLVELIDAAWTLTKPDESRKYALWFLDTVKGNPAMENIVRAPEMTALTNREPETRLKDAHSFHGACRIWLDDNLPIQLVTPDPPLAPADATAIDIPPPPPHSPPPPDTMQVDEDVAEYVTDAPEEFTEESSGVAPIETQIPPAEDVDTVMEGNADPDAVEGSIPVAAQRTYNSNLDNRLLASFDNVFVFLKCFDAESQALAGVKTLWVKQDDRVGYTIRQAMSWEDDVGIDVYQEQLHSTLVSVKSSSTFQSIGGASNYILIVQKRLNTKDENRLTAAGKPTTIRAYFRYQCSACDPAYLQPHLTRSYFASPYFSGSIAYGSPHGQGTLITTLGDAYTGTFVSGTKSGQGNMSFANGDTYTGSWAKDEPDGQGEMVYAKTGNVYTGGFKKRKRHGKGVMRFEVADEEERLCGICMEEEMDCCFYDCGHVAACEGCARQVDVCPVCRRGVKAVVRIWKS